MQMEAERQDQLARERVFQPVRKTRGFEALILPVVKREDITVQPWRKVL
jgi:hypothetical protein